jgi:hypothetical protein
MPALSPALLTVVRLQPPQRVMAALIPGDVDEEIDEAAPDATR